MPTSGCWPGSHRSTKSKRLISTQSYPMALFAAVIRNGQSAPDLLRMFAVDDAPFTGELLFHDFD